MSLLESILYGLISGITEFLPISSLAHQKIFQMFFGLSAADPLQDLFVHVALLAAVLSGCRGMIEQLRRGRQLQLHKRRGIRGNSDVLELQFLKNAILPMLISHFILFNCFVFDNIMVWIVIFSSANALMLFLTSRMMQGNKDEQSMSILDSWIIGISGSFAVFPGISRVAAMLSAATIRGIDRKKAANWVLLLSVPALVFASFLDILSLLTAAGRAHITGTFFGYLFSGFGAYIAGYLGVVIVRSAATDKDYSGYSYYALGVMLFSLFLYLFIV